MKRTKLLNVMLIMALFVLFSCCEDSTGPYNVKPGKPSNPIPEDNETDVSLTTTISWDCIDYEGDPLTYDIYFGTSSSPSIVNPGQSGTTYDPGTLIQETTYYWKIKAHDNHYNSTTGDVWQFTTSSGGTGTVTDIDGNVYPTILIGDQEWMAENLKVTHYRNGDPIHHVTDNDQWTSLSSGAYCYYDNDPSNVDTYGALYNWYAVDYSRNIATAGWHVPTDNEIKELEIYLGMTQAQADDTGYRGTNEGSMLAGNANLWYDGALENNSEFGTSGFTALPGGYRYGYDGGFYDIGYYAGFWSSTEYYSYNSAWYRSLNYRNSEVVRGNSSKVHGFSVRCVRD